ncbi:hypothetical protein V5799_016628 [Amblyomma americanum]|uniref:Uncharacterized protein n=1 Tax=Amblyomma americanum TaxID=6943 RepID=A0AAQ4F567_AMBAM
MLSGRVRSFLVGEDEDLAGQLGVAAENYEDLYYGGETPLKFDDGLQNGDRLSAAWRKQMADTLLARPALVQRRRSSTRVTSAVEVFAPYRHPITRQTTKAPNTSSSESPHLRRFLDILNAHGARHLREPPPQAPMLCRCSPMQNESGNGTSDTIAELTTTSATTSRQPPLLLVVPVLLVAPRDGPLAVVLENRTTTERFSVPKLASNAVSTSVPMPTATLKRRRLRFVLLLVIFVLTISASLAYYMR